MANQTTFHTQPGELFGDPANIVRIEENPHVVRSIGNCVGTAPFSNTNRKGRSTRRLNRKARAHGFPSHKAFVAHLSAIINLKEVQKDA